MATVLETQISLSPGNQIARLLDATSLVVDTQYLVTSQYLQSNTRFTYQGNLDIALTLVPQGVPVAGTQVPCAISTVPAPAVAQPSASYPYAVKDRLQAPQLNHDFENAPGLVPPNNPNGTAHLGRLWLDTSVTPPAMRVCAVSQASASYVANEWYTLGQVGQGTVAGQGVYLPLTGGGAINGNLTVNGNLSVSGASSISTPSASVGTLVITSGGTSVTPPTADNSTAIATTAYVKSQGYATTAQLAGYLPLAGGTLSGPLYGQGCQFAGITSTGVINGGSGNIGGVALSGNSVSAPANVQAGQNVIFSANIAGPSGYTLYGPGFSQANAINIYSVNSTFYGNLTVNGALNVGNGISFNGQVSGGSNGFAYFGSNAVGFTWDGGSLHYWVDRGLNRAMMWGPGIATAMLDGGFGVAQDPGSPSGWCFLGRSGSNNFESFCDGVSDARLKENVVDTKVDALAALCAVRVRSFEWRKEAHHMFGTDEARAPVAAGLIAQEVQEHIPAAVGVSTHERDDGLPEDMHRIMDERLTPYVIRALQQLAAKVEALEKTK